MSKITTYNNVMKIKRVALLADIVDSKSFEDKDRFVLQERLRKIKDILNDVFKINIMSPFEFSSGDSIQCLLSNPMVAIECSYLLRTLFYPYRIRCGIGVGDVNDMLYDESKELFDDGSSNYVDGKAYHLAKDALDIAKIRNDDFFIESEDRFSDFQINYYFSMSSFLRRKNTKTRAKLLNIFEYISPLVDSNNVNHFSDNFNKCIELLKIDNEILDNYMYMGKFYFELRNIMELNIEPVEYFFDVMLDSHSGEVEILSRSSDIYISKLLSVSHQNISMIKKRGNMNKIRTTDLLALMYAERNYKNG